MSLSPQNRLSSENLSNPLDAVEQVLSTYDMDYVRMDDDELVLSVAGQCTSYNLHLNWQDEFGALQIICQYPESMVPGDLNARGRLLMTANAQLWLGHFEFSLDGVIQFRYTTLMPDHFTTGVDQMNDLFKLSVAECDRFYPALRLICDAPDTPDNVIAFALQDIMGEC
jgi:hypothetical protein